MKKCAVIGSVNMDMVTQVVRFPQPGETILGKTFSMVPGGKGANQAVALGRLGVPVAMAGRVGDDVFGHQYLEHFRRNDVNADFVAVDAGSATGTATIEVNEEGENHIIVVSGANRRCNEAWLENVLDGLKDWDIFLFQLEINPEIIWAAIRRLHAMGKTIILDPAPAAAIPEEILSIVDIITPNETELKIITGDLPENADTPVRMQHLLDRGVKMVIHKCGSNGAYIATGDRICHVPGFKVAAVDTTAAGDTFNAGVAAGLAMGYDIEKAVRLGNGAAALAVTAFGAQEGMPTMEKVQAFMEKY